MAGKSLMAGAKWAWKKTTEINAEGKARVQRKKETEAQNKAEQQNAKLEKQRVKAERLKAKEVEKYGNLDAGLPEAEREKILSDEIRKFTGWTSPYKIHARGPTWAQLVDPAGDPIGTGGTVMAIATLGLSLATAPIRRGRDNDKTLYIEVHPNGMIERSGSLLHGGKDYSHVPRE